MLELTPISLKEANAFVAAHHRHHRPVVGHKFSIGCSAGGALVGVVIVGRPVSRHLDDGWTECGVDGAPISDTRRYQMLGNSVAVPCMAYFMQGIRRALEGR